MASAWGSSWGSAWGDSWGTVGGAAAPVKRGGGIGHSGRRPLKIVLSVNGEERTIDEDEIEEFVEEIKETIDSLPNKTRRNGSYSKPPVIVIKSAPNLALWDIQRSVNKSNDILKVVWQRSMQNYLNELEDEDAITWILQ